MIEWLIVFALSTGEVRQERATEAICRQMQDSERFVATVDGTQIPARFKYCPRVKGGVVLDLVRGATL